MTRRRSRRVVKVRSPAEQAPFFTLPGRAGGDFVNLLWNWGSSVTVTGRDVLDLLAFARNGSVIIARRMTAGELRRQQEARCAADQETHAHVVPNDTARWRAGRM